MKNLLFVMALALSSPASAETSRVDFTTPIVVDGAPVIDDVKCPIKQEKRDCNTPLTVGNVVYYSLERPDSHQTWADAIKRDDLAKALRGSKDFPLLDEQRAIIRDAVGPLWAPPILGFIRTVIEPAIK